MMRRSHLSCCVGLQRMMQGDIWNTLPTPSAPAMSLPCEDAFTKVLYKFLLLHHLEKALSNHIKHLML